MPWWAIMLIVMAVALILLFVLYKFGDKLQKKQLAQKEQMMAAAQPVTMLVIDKKFLPLKDANLPKQVLEQTPKRAQRAKVPVVKAKIGPRVMTLIADEDVYDLIPVKAEIKAMISGIYITSINNFRKAPVPKPEKKGFMAKLRKNASDAQANIDSAKAEKEKKKSKKK